MSLQLAHGGDVRNLFSIGIKREALGHLPDEDLAIFGCGGDHTIIERVPPRLVSSSVRSRYRGRGVAGFAVPVGVEDGRRVSAEKGDHVGELASLVQRYDSKGATARGIPID